MIPVVQCPLCGEPVTPTIHPAVPGNKLTWLECPNCAHKWTPLRLPESSTAPTPIRPVERPVDPDLVALLEKLLEQVKSGEIVALAGVSVLVNREHQTWWQGKCHLSEIIYTMECWKHRQLRAAVRD